MTSTPINRRANDVTFVSRRSTSRTRVTAVARNARCRVEPLESRVLLSTYYVDDTGGSNSAAGGESTPWATLQKAADTVVAGDTVIVRPGNYAGFTESTGGTGNSSRITYSAQPGATITSGNSSGYGIWLLAPNGGGVDYVTVEGFTIDFAYQTAIRVAGSNADYGNGVIVRNNTIRNGDYAGVLAAYQIGGECTDNTISDTQRNGIYYANSCDDVTIARNTLSNIGKHGIVLNGDVNFDGDALMQRFVIDRNTIRGAGRLDNTGCGMWIAGMMDGWVTNNLITDVGFDGIQMTGEIDAAQGSKRNVIANNTVVGCGKECVDFKSDANNNYVFNNVLYNDTGYVGTGPGDGTGTSLRFQSGADGNLSDYNALSTRTRVADTTYNTLSALQANSDAHSISIGGGGSGTDLRSSFFVNWQAGDYRMRPASPALDAGAVSLSGKAAPALDRDASPRPLGAGWDMGAFEGAGAPDTAAPIISAVAAAPVTANTFRITWTTNEAADSQVEYGATASYGSSTTLDAARGLTHAVQLSSLAPNTVYHYRVKSKDAAGNPATSADFTFTTPAPDTTAPLITAVAAPAPTATGATVTWLTNEAADTQVEYGPTAAYGSSTTTAATLVTTHSAVLAGLAPSTVYHYRVRSRDASGNLAVSADATFTTGDPGQAPFDAAAYFEFNESSGTTAADASGNGNAGTLTGGTAFTDGHSGGGLSFDGVDGAVRVSRSPVLETQSVSMAAWVLLPAGFTQANSATIVKKAYDDDNSSPYGSYSLRLSPGGQANKLAFSTGHATGNQLLISPAALPTGRWVHVAATFDRTTGRKTLYVDGTAVATTVTTRGDIVYDRTAAGDLYMGKDPGDGEAFAGTLDAVGVWGRTLSAADVAQLAHDAVAVDTTPPIIAAVAAGEITPDAATVTWSTDEASDSQVEFGTSTAYGSNVVLDERIVTSHAQALSGLLAGTVYHYRVMSRDAAGNVAASPDATFTTLPPLDVTAPALGDVTAIGITDNSSTVTWSTNESADGQVEFGASAAYGSRTALDATSSTSHAARLTGLAPLTTYHYRVLSHDGSGNLAISPDFTFTTAPATEPMPPQVGGNFPGTVIEIPGTPITFTATYSDPNGWDNLAYVYLRVNAELPIMLDAVYQVPTNRLFLRNEAGELAGGFAPGTPQVVSNSCGSLNCAAVSVTHSGDTLSVTWNLTAFQPLAGTNTLYVRDRDLEGHDSGYVRAPGATWTVTGDQAPSAAAVIPDTASDPVGVPRNFTATYNDPDGWANLNCVYFRLNSDLATMVDAIYHVPSNRLYLRNDDATALIGGFAPGSNNVISNSAGSLNCAAVTVTRSGNDLTVNWNLTAAQVLAGANPIYLRAVDRAGHDTRYGRPNSATWTVTGNGGPVNVAVSPGAAVDAAMTPRVLTATYSDADGWGNLDFVWLTLNQNDPSKRLQAVYNVQTNRLYLLNDDGTSIVGGFAPGSTNVITTARGSLDCAATTVTRGGNTLTVNWSLAASSALAGANTIWLRSRDHGGLDTLYERQTGALWSII